MRKMTMGRRVIPAALAVSLAWTVPAYAEEFVPGPGQPYDDATMARIQDNVLEYEEIGLLVDTYNPTLKNVKDTYSDTKDDYKDVDKLKNQIMEGSGSLADQAGQLSGMAGTFEDLLGYQNMVTPGTYAELVYSSEVLSQQAEQMTLSADSLSAVTPEMLKVKMVDSTRAALVSGAQSAMIGYEQLLLQKESLEDSITLLEEVYKSTQTQASLGLATENGQTEPGVSPGRKARHGRQRGEAAPEPVYAPGMGVQREPGDPEGAGSRSFPDRRHGSGSR